jgi:hypothetical protein
MGDMTFLITPQGDRLPGLTTLLHTDTVERHLEPQIRQASNEILDRRVAYVRYRPSGNCVARYVITHRKRLSGATQELFWYGVCCTPETFANAHRKVVAKPWVKPTFGPPFIALTDYKTLLFAYPNDRRLDGLRILDCEDTLREFLCNHLPEERWPSADEKLSTTVVRYKPENRAVLRCEAESQPQSSDTTIYLRIFPSKRSATAMHSIMSDLFGWLGPQAKLCIPKPLASDPTVKIDYAIVYVRAPRVLKLEPGALEQPREGAAGEEPQVGRQRVEGPLEPADEHVQAGQAAVGGRRDREPPAGAKHPPRLRYQQLDVLHVLDRLHAEHQVD